MRLPLAVRRAHHAPFGLSLSSLTRRVRLSRTTASSVNISTYLLGALNQILKNNSLQTLGFDISTRFFGLTSYLGQELGRCISDQKVLGRVRMHLLEKVPPMSTHIALVRIYCRNVLSVDLLIDTTGSRKENNIFCSIAFDPLLKIALGMLERFSSKPIIEAY